MPEGEVSGRQAVDRLMADAGAGEMWSQLDSAERDKFASEIETKLEAIARSAPPDEEGGARIVGLGWSFRITGTIWPLIVFTAKVAIAAHDPTGLTWKNVVPSVIDLLSSLADAVRKLDPTQQRICAAIAQKRAEHRQKGISPDGATEQDIKDAFVANGQLPPVTLNKQLDALTEGKVIVRQDDPQRGALYRISF